MVGLLNLATFIVGFRMRGRLENIAGIGAGGTSSPFSGYMAMRALGGIGRTANRATRGAIGGALTATPILAGATAGAARLGGMSAAAGARGIGNAAPRPEDPAEQPPDHRRRPAGGGGIATPYRPPRRTGGTGPGRKALTATPAATASGRRCRPRRAPQRGQTRALEAAGTGRQTVGDGSRSFVAPDPTPTPRRTFAPTTPPRATRPAAPRRPPGSPGRDRTGRHRTWSNPPRTPGPGGPRPAPPPRPRRELPAPPSRHRARANAGGGAAQAGGVPDEPQRRPRAAAPHHPDPPHPGHATHRTRRHPPMSTVHADDDQPQRQRRRQHRPGRAHDSEVVVAVAAAAARVVPAGPPAVAVPGGGRLERDTVAAGRATATARSGWQQGFIHPPPRGLGRAGRRAWLGTERAAAREFWRTRRASDTDIADRSTGVMVVADPHRDRRARRGSHPQPRPTRPHRPPAAAPVDAAPRHRRVDQHLPDTGHRTHRRPPRTAVTTRPRRGRSRGCRRWRAGGSPPRAPGWPRRPSSPRPPVDPGSVVLQRRSGRAGHRGRPGQPGRGGDGVVGPDVRVVVDRPVRRGPAARAGR